MLPACQACGRAAQPTSQKRGRQVFARSAAALSASTQIVHTEAPASSVSFYSRLLRRRVKDDFARNRKVAFPTPNGETRRSSESAFAKWLGHQDSNLDSWYQKPESCRWTMAQSETEAPAMRRAKNNRMPSKQKWWAVRESNPRPWD